MTVAEPSADLRSRPEAGLSRATAAALDHALDAMLAPRLAAAQRGSRPTLVSGSVPLGAVSVDPMALERGARALGQPSSVWLQPWRGFGLVGIGDAWSLEADGAGRFATLGSAWRELRGAAHDDPAGVRGTGPLLLGGLAFDGTRARSDVWRGFERARLVLPRLMLTMTPTGGWLTRNLVVVPGEAGVLDEAGADRVERLVGAGSAPGAEEASTPRTGLRLIGSRPEAADWFASVARCAGAVGRGRLDKVVLTRSVDLLADEPIDVTGVLRRLVADAPGSTVFAFTDGGRTFLGATPERLVEVVGDELWTVALAGSTRRGSDATADDALAAELMGSDKEREEHAVVVDMIRRTLAPLTEKLSVADGPSIVRLRHVQHLATHVRGRLREPTGILALVERLHPTPAVGGAPTDLALELIGDEERHERGWYAGPVGWLDASDEGEFAVALRSGVIDGPTATLLAGCGIVADSDPAREWEESSVKLRALGTALGRVVA